MKNAIKNSIYYLDVYNFNNPVITFEYIDEESFKNVIKDFSNNIEIVATFGLKDNICYKIFDELSYLYKDLLFDKTTSIYLVSRKDICICLCREKQEHERIAIIKIDSVLSEYKHKSLKPYFLYPLTFIFGGIVLSSLSNYISE